MYDVREGKAQIFRQLIEHMQSGRVVLFQSGSEKERFAAAGIADQSRQQTAGLLRLEPTDAGVDRPAGAKGFDNRSLAIQTKMSKFGFTRRIAVIDLTACNEPAAHSAPHRDVEDRIMAPTCAVVRFPQRADVRVILHRDRELSG